MSLSLLIQSCLCLIYNSRNYSCLLAVCIYHVNFYDLQQQKLFISLSLRFRTLDLSIYNSRNYSCLLAVVTAEISNIDGSTIVEIIHVSQPLRASSQDSLSTIVEIIHVSQPVEGVLRNYRSTIVEIIHVSQPDDELAALCDIYNSRNYSCLLAFFSQQAWENIYNSRNYSCLLARYNPAMVVSSTIVEIIHVSQPHELGRRADLIYNSRNYSCLLAQLFYQSHVVSTIVEIIHVSQPYNV